MTPIGVVSVIVSVGVILLLFALWRYFSKTKQRPQNWPTEEQCSSEQRNHAPAEKKNQKQEEQRNHAPAEEKNQKQEERRNQAAAEEKKKTKKERRIQAQAECRNQKTQEEQTSGVTASSTKPKSAKTKLKVGIGPRSDAAWIRPRSASPPRQRTPEEELNNLAKHKAKLYEKERAFNEVLEKGKHEYNPANLWANLVSDEKSLQVIFKQFDSRYAQTMLNAVGPQAVATDVVCLLQVFLELRKKIIDLKSAPEPEKQEILQRIDDRISKLNGIKSQLANNCGSFLETVIQTRK